MSKTVKRVSKTVKRVTTVMMIGLVAMLGAKAEAHYILVKNKIKFCSICIDVEHTEADTPAEVDVVMEADTPAEVEVVVTTKNVEILCSTGTVVKLTKPVMLSTRKAITNITKSSIININGEPISGAKEEVVVSDAPFLAPFRDVRTTFCPSRSNPLDVLIREMFVEIDTFDTQSKLAYTWKAACVLPAKFHFKNRPPFGHDYTCEVTEEHHDA